MPESARAIVLREVAQSEVDGFDQASVTKLVALLRGEVARDYMVLGRKLCADCGELAFYDDYFAAYVCPQCGWRESLIDELRRLLNQLAASIASR